MDLTRRPFLFQTNLMAAIVLALAGNAVSQSTIGLSPSLPEYYAGQTTPMSIGAPAVATAGFTQASPEELLPANVDIHRVVAQVAAPDRPSDRPSDRQVRQPLPPIDKKLERSPQPSQPGRAQGVQPRRESTSQIDREHRDGEEAPNRRADSRPPVYDGLPIRPEGFRPPMLRARDIRDEDDDDDDDDEEELERILDTIDRILESQLVERFLKLKEENLELQARLQMIELERKLEAQAVNHERELDEVRKGSFRELEEREQLSRRQEGELQELRHALAQRERELELARSMNEQMERVAERSRQQVEAAMDKHHRELEGNKHNATEMEHRIRVLQSNLEQAQHQLQLREKKKDTTDSPGAPKKEVAKDSDKGNARKKSVEKQSVKNRPTPKKDSEQDAADIE